VPVEIATIVLGPLETNTYVIRCDETCAVVDPGMSPGALLEYLAGKDAQVDLILLTHGHGDHFAGADQIKARHGGARLCCPAADADMLGDAELNMSASFGMMLIGPQPDELLAPGGVISIGSSQWQILDTSGHSPGGISYYCSDAGPPAAGVVLTGDALFCGGIGRTDIPGAQYDLLVKNIREQLLSLPDRTKVLPGHGPATTIGRERRTNPFVGER